MAIGQSQGVLLGLGGSVLTGLDGAGQQQQQQQTARERLPHNQSVGAAGSSRPDKRVAAEAKVCRSGLDDVREPLQTPPTTLSGTVSNKSGGQLALLELQHTHTI